MTSDQLFDPSSNPSAEQLSKQPTLEEFKVEEFDLRRRASNQSTDYGPDADMQEAKNSSNYQSPDIKQLDSATIDRVIEMAWEDRTPFGAIETQFGLKEKDVIAVMRRYMKRSSFKMWRKRVTDRKTKHAEKREFDVGRFHSSNQKNY